MSSKEISDINKIIAAQISCDPMDLYSIKHTTEMNLELCRDKALKKDLIRINDLYDLVTKSGVGHGVDIRQNNEGKLVSQISYGHSLYLYVTDDQDGMPVTTSSSYQEVILDLLGAMKDGDVHIGELYIRKCSRVECGEPNLDQHLINYRVDDELFRAVDKDSLARMVDFKLRDMSMEEYVSAMASIVVVPDKVYGEGSNNIVVQHNMGGSVTEVRFNELTSEIIDAMLQNTLIKFRYIKPVLLENEDEK